MKYKVTMIETIIADVEVEADNIIMARLLAHGVDRDNWREDKDSYYVETGEVEEVAVI
jgi:hypothetical protein